MAEQLEKNDSAFASSQQVPIALQLTGGLMSPSPIHDEILVGSVDFRSGVGNHSYCEFLSVMALSCLEGRTSQHSSQPSSLYITSALNLVGSLSMERCGIDIKKNF